MKKILYTIAAAVALVSCSETTGDGTKGVTYDESQVIKVAGVTYCDVASVETRATNGEDNETLKEVLMEGLPITYYLGTKPAETQEAVLKLVEAKPADSDYAKYSFNLKGTENPATWLGNGGHVFHGIYIPTSLSTYVRGMEENQSQNDENDYYNTLESYLCMPPNHEIQATVGYVRLPFTHRLSRVVSYVLIEPDLNTTVDTVYMENVQVLKQAIENSSPEWMVADRVYPHFVGKLGSLDSNMKPIDKDHLYAYYDKKKDKWLYPTTEGWKAVHQEYSKLSDADKESYTYTQIDYGKAPCYDIIVRPTYTDTDLVMYDEASDVNADETNNVDYVVKLKNGLTYRKSVTVDLDANYFTVIYLRVTREKVDYQSSGSEVWQTQVGNDGPYGLDNENELRLSKAGGSWQRAYRIGTDENPVTDGSEYSKQYITKDDWLTKFKAATVDGDNWGDYFVLLDDLTIDKSQLPENFDFAGHLDGRGHTITLTGDRGYLFDGLNGTYTADSGKANLHTEKDGKVVPLSGFRAGVMNLTVKGGTLFSSTAEADKENKITGYVTNCTNETTE